MVPGLDDPDAPGLDPGPLARQAADFIDELEERYGEGAELEGVLMIADIRLPDGHPGGDGATQWHFGDLSSSHACGLAFRAASALAEGDPIED